MRLSAIIPTFNRKSRLGAAIDSVLGQGVDVEIWIVDDGSTDGTREWLASAYPEDRVRVIGNSRTKGPAGARNTGMLAANGQLIAFLDSDDAFLPNHLVDAVRAFERFPELGLVFGRAIYEQDGRQVPYMGPNFEAKLAMAPCVHADDELVVFGPDFFYHLLDQGCWFNLSTVVMRPEAARALMREELRVAEDYEFWVRLARRYSFGCLLNEQIRYALHDANVSFETEKNIAANSPQLLHAYEIIRDQLDGDSRALKLVERNMAYEYFNWGYRARKAGNYLLAFDLHRRSLGHGMLVKNLAAMLKIPVAKLMRH
jgi:glycosyltransferase involved in cell wall biosynthesis